MDKKPRTILIVDDNEINRTILSDMLSSDFGIIEAKNGEEAVDILKDRNGDITIVLLDVVMPKLDGFGVLASMNANHWIENIPVVMISSESSVATMRKAFELGAIDYVNRPFDYTILRRRIMNTIVLYSKQNTLTNILVEQIKDRERESKLMVSILSHIVEFRNGESGKHVQNIGIITEMLLNKLMSKTDKYNEVLGDIDVIKMASALHDIGKIGIPEEILNKPGRLTKEEFEIMKTHSAIGSEMMNNLPDCGNEKLVKYAYQICRWHHEKYDGRGYPDGLVGDNIPIAAQLVSVADVYDALCSKRCYKDAYSHEKAIEMILGGECGAFNPILMECLVELGELLPESLKAVKEISDDKQLEQELRRRILEWTL